MYFVIYIFFVHILSLQLFVARVLVGNATNMQTWTKLLQDGRLVQHCKLVRGIFSCVKHNNLGSTWMIIHELCHIIYFPIENDPAVIPELVVGFSQKKFNYKVVGPRSLVRGNPQGHKNRTYCLLCFATSAKLNFFDIVYYLRTFGTLHA